uniref:SKI/SNO/DAC domain-containing protein n=1 Tax=Gopherus agassizii TaxID=38772 RepID=A0A452HD57_9SAUR
METLKIKSRRCDLRELRTLKAINSVPTRAVKCSLISKADLEALCTSCKSLSPRRRKRKRREQLLLPGPADLFDCPRQPLRSSCGAGPYRTQEPGSCGELAPAPHRPPGGLFQNYDKATRGRKGYGLGDRGGLFAGVLSAYPRDLQLLHSAARGAHGAGQAHPQPEPGRPKRCSKGLFPEEKGQGAARKSRLFPGCKRQGTSAGYSSDSDSSLDFGGSSPTTSSDSEEEEEEEEGDTSCSSEEGSSSESESSSLCSGDSVQSTRYRQAALPRFQQLHHPPREPSGDERLPELHKAALRPDPNLLLLSQQLWARTLRASTLESLRPLPALGAGVQQQQEPELACAKQEPPSSQPSQGRSYPGGDPQQKAGDCGATKPCAQGEDLHKDASNNAASLGPSDQAKRQLAALAGRSASQEPALGSASPPSAQEFAGSLSPAPQRVLGEPRREHFDRLIRQSKLWCYAKGFNADGKSLRPGGRTEPCKAAELQCSGSKSARSPSPLPQKTPRRNAPKGKTQCRNSFSLLGNFPCTPSLVVGEDGDLRPAASLCVKNSCALSKTHPLWSWQVGGSALPVPPSLKFRGYGLEGF